MKIYDGGFDKGPEGYYDNNNYYWIDILLNEFTGNSLPPTTLSNGNQMFISLTSNGNGFGKGFSASFAFGKKTGNFNFFELVPISHLSFLLF